MHLGAKHHIGAIYAILWYSTKNSSSNARFYYSSTGEVFHNMMHIAGYTWAMHFVVIHQKHMSNLLFSIQ